MLAVEITKRGGPKVLKVRERADPALRPGWVRIEVAACGVSFADVLARTGVYPDERQPPFIAGREVAGTVLELGERVEGLTHGQRVVAGMKFGGYASQVCVPERDCVLLPERLTFEQGAAVPIDYATAWAALVGYGRLQAGERVLIHSASECVGIAAIQIAGCFGAAEVYGTASPTTHERLRELGVDHVLDHGDVTVKGGLPAFDVILDPLGGRSPRTSYKLLRTGGRLVALGGSSAASHGKRKLGPALFRLARMPRFSLVKQVSESKSVIGLDMLSLWKDRETLQPWIEPLGELLQDGTIEPVIAGTFALEEAGAAHEMFTQRHNFGKVVLVP
jgi:NADPH:quinone reductase-like Zn-dependent oxidoreductase